MPALRNILVAVRPGSLDSHPLRSAMALATRARARLSGLSVAPSPRARAHIESTLAEGIPMHTALGIPAIEIVREAESKGTDLLVLGRELSPQMDLRHDGNTVEGTVRRARIPCLVVPRGQEKFAILAGVGASTGLHEVPPAGGGETIIRQGDPVSEILRVVRDEDVDLLVFGHHRGGPISSHATSGVAARLLQRAPCAVLTVPI